jgi:hypothetical protein
MGTTVQSSSMEHLAQLVFHGAAPPLLAPPLLAPPSPRGKEIRDKTGSAPSPVGTTWHNCVRAELGFAAPASSRYAE